MAESTAFNGGIRHFSVVEMTGYLTHSTYWCIVYFVSDETFWRGLWETYLFNWRMYEDVQLHGGDGYAAFSTWSLYQCAAEV